MPLIERKARRARGIRSSPACGSPRFFWCFGGTGGFDARDIVGGKTALPAENAFGPRVMLALDEPQQLLNRLALFHDGVADVGAIKTADKRPCFLQLQARITSLEEQISDRRELYNESVNLYNTRQAMFPDSVIAGMGDFKPSRLLEFSADETSDPSVKELFKG